MTFSRNLMRFVLITAFSLLLLPLATAQTVSVTTGIDLSVRSGAGTNFERLGVLTRGTTVLLEARDAANTWALGTTADGTLRGWMAVRYLNFPPGANYFTLPTSIEVVDGTVVAAPVAGNPAAAGESLAAPAAVSNINPALTAGASVVLNIRAEDSTRSAVIGRLARNEAVYLLGRNTPGNWLQIQTLSGVTGWVAARYMIPATGVSFAALPDVNSLPPVVADANTAVPVAPPPPTNSGIPAADFTSSNEEIIARLRATPRLYQFDRPVIASIVAEGRSQGRYPNVFIKVGDSITATQRFMTEFGIPGNYQLLGYSNLQPTVNFFSSPIAGGDNSFLRRGQAMGSAFNAASILDPIWSDPRLCRNEESPLACEVRLANPSVAIIMLGSVDMQIYGHDYYTVAMETIISYLVEEGVVPVLTTFPVAPQYLYYERSLEFNILLLDLAETYGIPVINLWAATVDMPRGGAREDDLYHLSEAPNRADFTFDGRENEFGLSARNLLSLQALDILRTRYLQ